MSRGRITDRRSFIKTGLAVATGSQLALAGCLGGGGGSGGGSGGNGGGGKTTIKVGTAAGSSASELLAALQRVVNQKSNKVQIVAQEAPGDPAVARLYNDGEVNAITNANYTANLANSESGPFAEKPIEKYPFQGLIIATYNLHWVARQGTDIETVDDLPGKNLYPLPPSWSFRQMIESVHKEYGIWSDMKGGVLNLDTADVPGAFDEGRIDASISYVTNQKGLTSFMREVSARSKLKIVQPTDGWLQAIKDAPAVSPEEFELIGYEGDVGQKTAQSMAQAAQLFFGDTVPKEAAYEIARISHEQNEEIVSGFDQYLNHSDVSLMHSLWLTDPNIAVHPGMAQFVKEQGAWDSETHTVADI